MRSVPRILAPLLLVLACGCAVPRLYGEGVGVQTNVLGGGRALDHDTFDAAPVLGLELASHDPDVGWGYELGGSFGTDDVEGGGLEHEGEFQEIYLGLRREFESTVASARPYLGLGGAWMKTENTLRSSTDPTTEFDDRGGGAYLHGGLLWSLGHHFAERGTEVLVGFDVRGALGDDLDYAQGAFVIGFGR